MSAAMLARARGYYRKTGDLSGAARLIGLTTAELDWLLWTGAREVKARGPWTAQEDRTLKSAYPRFGAPVLVMGLGRSMCEIHRRAAVIGAYFAEAA